MHSLSPFHYLLKQHITRPTHTMAVFSLQGQCAYTSNCNFCRSYFKLLTKKGKQKPEPPALSVLFPFISRGFLSHMLPLGTKSCCLACSSFVCYTWQSHVCKSEAKTWHTHCVAITVLSWAGFIVWYFLCVILLVELKSSVIHFIKYTAFTLLALFCISCYNFLLTSNLYILYK